MANGDAAAIDGMDLVAATDDRRQGYDEINKTRDYIAGRIPRSDAAASGAAVGNKLVRYKSNTRITTSFPLVDTDAANKAYVDQAVDAIPTPTEVYGSSAYNGNLAAGVYDRPITWTRRAVWVGNNGQIGWASSKRATKQNFAAPEWTPEQLMQIPILHYRYRAAVNAERRGEGRAAIEIGTIADDLHALGLWEFVTYEGRGEDAKPEGVHYELLGLAALWLAQRAYELAADNARRLDALEARDA